MRAIDECESPLPFVSSGVSGLLRWAARTRFYRVDETGP